MPYERLAEITDEMNICMETTVTHLRRFKILCDKAEIPPGIRQEFGEFFVDWGTNLTRYGKLLSEHTELLLPLIDDLKEYENGHNETTA